jgi:hypothetical protein
MARPQWDCRWWAAVTLGRTVSLDPRAWRRHEGDTFFGLEQSELRITGPGLYPAGRDQPRPPLLYGRGDHAAGGVALGRRFGRGRHHHLPRPVEPPAAYRPGRRHFIERCASPFFEHEGVRYDRFWLEAYENDQDPVILTEDVYEDWSGRATRQVVQVCMLYSRALEAGGTELLLALEVAPDHGSIVQELMVGLPLAPTEFNA